MAFQDFFAIGLQSNRNRREPAGALRALTTMTNYTALNVARQLSLFAADEPALYLDDDDENCFARRPPMRQAKVSLGGLRA